jgi:DNA-binding transcriptional MerR regulator
MDTRKICKLRIGPVADWFGVSAESLRVWERQGLIPPAHRTPGGHRRYGKPHLRALVRLFREERPGEGAMDG